MDSEKQYRRDKTATRLASLLFTGTPLETDEGFLRYVRSHIEYDGPDALFTPMQIERLRRLVAHVETRRCDFGILECYVIVRYGDAMGEAK